VSNESTPADYETHPVDNNTIPLNKEGIPLDNESTPAQPWSMPVNEATVGRDGVRKPPIRWGGIVWGLILLALSGFVLFTISSPTNRYAFSYWLSHLTPGSGWTLAVVAVGGIILVLALLAAIRSAQRKRRA